MRVTINLPDVRQNPLSSGVSGYEFTLSTLIIFQKRFDLPS